PMTVVAIIAFGSTAIAFAALEDTKTPSLYVIPASTSVLGLILMLFVNIRLCCFAQHLIIDQNLGAIEAIRSCWYLSRNHFWGLLWLKLKLHGLLLLYGLLTLGMGLIFVMPYTNLVWTAGYLDILNRYPAPEEETGQEGEEM